MPDAETFKARYWEFAKRESEEVQLFLDEAALEISQEVWGNFYRSGVMALAAHLMKLAMNEAKGKSGTASQLIGKKAGEIQMTYGAVPVQSMDDAYLASTVYGQRYLHLRSIVSVKVSVLVVR